MVTMLADPTSQAWREQHPHVWVRQPAVCERCGLPDVPRTSGCPAHPNAHPNPVPRDPVRAITEATRRLDRVRGDLKATIAVCGLALPPSVRDRITDMIGDAEQLRADAEDEVWAIRRRGSERAHAD